MLIARQISESCNQSPEAAVSKRRELASLQVGPVRCGLQLENAAHIAQEGHTPSLMVYADSLPASPQSGGPLTAAQIAQAIRGAEAPSSLYLSHLNISEIPDAAVQQLAQLRSVEDDENDGTILR